MKKVGSQRCFGAAVASEQHVSHNSYGDIEQNKQKETLRSLSYPHPYIKWNHKSFYVRERSRGAKNLQKS